MPSRFFRHSIAVAFLFTSVLALGANVTEAAPPGIMAVAWMDDTPGNSEIYLKTSSDDGATWSAAKRLTNNVGRSIWPSVAVSGTNIHVAWYDDTPGNYEIYLKTSSDNGATWSTAKRLTINSGDSAVPSIAVSGTNVHVVWQDSTPGNYEIYLKTSSDNGATWSAAKRLTNNGGWSEGVSVAVSGTNIHMAWSDDTAPSGRREIYYKTSSDNGVTWSAAKRLTNNAGDSAYPSIAR